MTGGNDIHSVVFRIGDERYALATRAAREVVAWEQPRRLPGAASHVLGVRNLRGELVVVCDLSSALGLEPTAHPTQVVVCDAPDGAVGIAVEEVVAVRTLEGEALAAPGTGSHPAVTSLARVDGSLVAVLDVSAVFAQDVAQIGTSGREAA